MSLPLEHFVGPLAEYPAEHSGRHVVPSLMIELQLPKLPQTAPSLLLGVSTMLLSFGTQVAAERLPFVQAVCPETL